MGHLLESREFSFRKKTRISGISSSPIFRLLGSDMFPVVIWGKTKQNQNNPFDSNSPKLQFCQLTRKYRNIVMRFSSGE